jgi:twitching motility protein PilT
MIDYINRTREEHIITIEDPIEFVHQNNKCLINQREIRTHTDSFRVALRAALREDPDIVLVGEMRDLETVAIAIETAETGTPGVRHAAYHHGGVHRGSRHRPVSLRPSGADPDHAVGIAARRDCPELCRKIGGGRVAALEVLIASGAISNLIREGKTFQINSMMQVGRGNGMVTLNDALMELVTKKLVAP